MFSATEMTNEEDVSDYGFYWSLTAHENTSGVGSVAVYVCFGCALGDMNNEWLDIHGTGAQRSDPKEIDNVSANAAYETVTTPAGSAIIHGPQGDVVRRLNFARCVRTISE